MGGAGEPRRFYFRSERGGRGRSCRPTAAFPRAATPAVPPRPALPTAPGQNSRSFSGKTRENPFPPTFRGAAGGFPSGAAGSAPLGILFFQSVINQFSLSEHLIPLYPAGEPQPRGGLCLTPRAERALPSPPGARGRAGGTRVPQGKQTRHRVA